jgi:hypothetical protein
VRRIARFLESAPRWHFALYSIFFSFVVYFCAIAFRKPFTVARFEGAADIPFLPAIDYKILLVISQVLGYGLAKFFGIKVVPELAARYRAPMIVGCILIAELALLLFGVTPRPWNAIFLFINGFPLGLVWGSVFSYLEGRRLSNLLGPAFSLSFIVGNGAVRSAGSYVLAAGISESRMPFATGLLFLPLFLVSVWFLDQLPPPDKEDERACTKRKPMDGQERMQFFRMFAPGLALLVFTYMIVAAYYAFRDNFARELWDALGYARDPKIFTISELPIAVGVLIALGLIVLIKDNKKSFIVTYSLMITGSALIGLATLGYQMQYVGPATWMIIAGLGLYLAYVPFGCTLYDNLVGMTHFAGTATFMMFVSEAASYLSIIGVIFYKNFGQHDLPWLTFMVRFSYAASIVTTVCLLASLYYFLKRLNRRPRLATTPRSSTAMQTVRVVRKDGAARRRD